MDNITPVSTTTDSDHKKNIENNDSLAQRFHTLQSEFDQSIRRTTPDKIQFKNESSRKKLIKRRVYWRHKETQAEVEFERSKVIGTIPDHYRSIQDHVTEYFIIPGLELCKILNTTDCHKWSLEAMIKCDAKVMSVDQLYSYINKMSQDLNTLGIKVQLFKRRKRPVDDLNLCSYWKLLILIEGCTTNVTNRLSERCLHL